MSFKHARDALVLCHDNGVIGDEEFCLLYDANRSKSLKVCCEKGQDKELSSYEKMPKRLVVYKKIFNTKILALVTAVV